MLMNIRKSIGNFFGLILVIGWDTLNHFDKRRNILSIYMHNPGKVVFECVINFLTKKQFCFISTGELENILSQKRPLTTKTVIVTLDDAWRGNLNNVIPIAVGANIPITIFTPIQPVEDGVMWMKWFRDKDLIDRFPEIVNTNPKLLPNSMRNELWQKLKPIKHFDREILTSDEVKLLAQKFSVITIGGHTYTHSILTNCNSKELNYEIIAAKEKLQEMIDKGVNVMAYPNGNYNDCVREVCRKAGYKIAFTTEEGIYIDIEQTDPLCIPRNCVPNSYGKWESIARALGVWQKIFRK